MIKLIAAVGLPKENITPLLYACLPAGRLSVGIAAEQRHQQPNYRKPFNRGKSTPNTHHRSETRL